MKDYAKIEDNIVVQVIVSEQAYIDTLEGTWLETSYNTYGGVHYNLETDEPTGAPALRKNYPSVGFTYDVERDAFISPKPFPSWSLEESTCLWLPPITYPENGNVYTWVEESQEWLQIYAKDENTDS